MKNIALKIIMIVFLLIFNTSVNAFEEIDIHGFISQGYLKSDHNNFYADTEDGTFEFNEMGINFGTRVTPRLFLSLQILALDLGDIGNDEITVDYAFADFRWKDWLGFRAGKAKNSVGLYGKYWDLDIVRPYIILPQGVYSSSFRDLLYSSKGVAVYGYLQAGRLGNFNYYIGYGQDDIPADGDIGSMIAGKIGGRALSEIKIDKKYGGVIDWNTPVRNLLLKYGQYKTKLKFIAGSDFEIHSEIPVRVFSVQYGWKDLKIEYERMWSPDTEEIIYINGLKMDPIFFPSLGFYYSLFYRCSKRIEIGTYHSQIYPFENDRRGSKFKLSGLPETLAWLKDYCLLIRFDLNDNFIFKMELHLMDGNAVGFIQDQYFINSGNKLEKNWNLYAMKITYIF